MEETMIKNLEEKTGKKFPEWIAIVQKSGLSKHGEIIKLLKEKYELTHGYANLIIHRAKGSDATAAQESGVDLVKEQYAGKAELYPIYEKLLKAIQGFGSDVEVAPKKTYVSLRRKKQFALIQPSTKTRLDIGFNLKGVKPEGKLEAGGSWNAMCSHRIKIESEKDADRTVVQWLKNAYDLAG